MGTNLMSKPFVSVVIPIRDNAQGLEYTVRSLAAQDFPGDEWEVIVVDDGSAVPAADTTAPFGLTNLRVERLHPGGGRSKARNLGIRSARGEVVLMLDGDSFAATDLVRRHAEFHRNSAPEAAQVLLGNRYEPSWATVNRLLDGDTASPKAAIEQDMRLSWFGVDASTLAGNRVPWAFVFTHNTSARREVLEAVGGFDEDFEGWGHEDIDLAYRLFEAAGRPEHQFVLDPEAYCFHVPHFRDFARQGVEERQNTELLRRKHPRFDIELFGGSRTHLAAKVAYYEDILDAFRADPFGELRPSDLGDVVDPSSDILLVGGTPPPDRSGRTVTWNLRAPVDTDNPHMFGVLTPFKDAEFDAVVHVDLWHFLLPDDLSALVSESLRISGRLLLLSTAPNRPGPRSGECDTDYLVRMLDGRLHLTVADVPAGRLITVER
jgi:glycosyltransferase involved in cell wall biosynthesis